MDAMGKIGECFWIGTCLVAFFVFLGFLTSMKFGLLIKFAIPIFGFLIGMCMGIYLGSLFSPTVARVFAIPFGLAGGFIGVSMSNQS